MQFTNEPNESHLCEPTEFGNSVVFYCPTCSEVVMVFNKVSRKFKRVRELTQENSNINHSCLWNGLEKITNKKSKFKVIK